MSLFMATVTMSAIAENPYAPTGNETVIGQTQVLYNPNKTKSNILTGADCGAEGWQIQCTGNTEKKLESGSTMTTPEGKYIPIKLSNGAQNTVTLPEGYVANAVTIYSTINKDAATDRPCYWKEVDGVEYPKPDTDNLTSFKDYANPDVSYFKLSGKNTFTFTNSGEQPFVVLVVDYSEAKTEPEFPEIPTLGDGALAAPEVWPLNGSNMLPLSGEILLSYDTDVLAGGAATIGDMQFPIVADGTTAKIVYSGLAPNTEYTVTVPARQIGTDAAANEEYTFTFTTGVENTLFYTDFHVYPYEYFVDYGTISGNTNLIPKSSTDVTEVVAGMTFYSGTKGRVVLMTGVYSDDLEKDYGPETEADRGATAFAAQLIDGSNGLYVETPEFEGPVELTFYLGNPDTKAGTVMFTDEEGDKDHPVYEHTFNAAKKINKVTFTYPYKGTHKIRLYNQKFKLDVNDILIVKGEGEGIDKPVYTDQDAPVVKEIYPTTAPFAGVEGKVIVRYDEPVVVAEGATATIGDAQFAVVAEGNAIVAAYSGLDNEKTYTAVMPAVTDEAGNETAGVEVTFTTAKADILYYTDFHYFPVDYYEMFWNIPNEMGDNADIHAKETTDEGKTIGGIYYWSGYMGRVVAMGKSNMVDPVDETSAGASDRCIQLIGGQDDLYLELPEVQGPANLTLYVASQGAAGNLKLTNGLEGDKAAALANFEFGADKLMNKYTYAFTENAPVKFRLWNMDNKMNIHDILIEKGTQSGIENVAVEAVDGEAVYFNLQGVRVANPANGGVYIRVQGDKAQKVLVK